MKQDDILSLDIIDVNSDGDGVARTESGQVVFVCGGITGEKVSAKVTFVSKKAIYAKILSVLSPSPDRISPLCPHHSGCGGCDLQHVSFEKEAEIKRNGVLTVLKKIAGIDGADIVLPTVQGKNVYGYRNKLQLPAGYVKNAPALGFYKKKTHDIIPLSVCPSNGEWSEKLISFFKEYISAYHISCYDEKTGKGVLRHIVARKVGKTLSVTVVVNANDLPKKNELTSLLKKNFEAFSLGYSVNKKNTNVIMGDDYHPVFGGYDIKEEYLGLKLVLSPISFLQVNDEIAKAIYEKVQSLIQPNGVVFDLYCGVGIMTSFIARKAKAVYGVEIVPDAVKNANNNFALNGITNAKAICGDVKDVLPLLLKKRMDGNNDLSIEKDDDPLSPVTVVVDPPRAGLDQSVIDTILSINPTQIIYVSCSPQTLARDLKIFLSSGEYSIDYMQPYNMFPRSKHVETVVLLSRK